MRARRTAFTLIELLVVIAIIGISGWAAAAGRAKRPGSRPANAMREQPQADRLGPAQFPRRPRELSGRLRVESWHRGALPTT